MDRETNAAFCLACPFFPKYSMIIIKSSKSSSSTRPIPRTISRTQYKFFCTNQILNMPLIDPVTTAAGGDKNAEWQNKLVGKKLGDSSDEVVSLISWNTIKD
jgi:hypothetical protein